MIKTGIQLLAILVLFFAVWFGLSRVDWMTLLNIKQTGERTEEKLGKIYWEIISRMHKEIKDREIIDPLDSMLVRICEGSDIDRKKIKFHLVESSEINAFAMPGQRLVLYSGLIDACENAEELCGVLAHEIAHMEEGHIMKKLSKEIGLSVLISMTTGGGSPEIIQQAIKILTSSAYDRKLEREADITGTEYLLAAQINPAPFADFLYRLSSREKDVPDQVFWISSHPGSEERAKYILDYIRNRDLTIIPVMDSIRWNALQKQLDSGNGIEF